MVNRKKFLNILSCIMIFSILFTGCNKIDKMKVKMGMKNNDFEYINEGKIKKIIIQNTRDKSFRFIVTDQAVIKDLYDILSTAKEVSNKSTLPPDYILEMQEDVEKKYKFNYIAGLDKEDGANLYSSNKNFIVSKRLDNDIIKNFWNITKPLDFYDVYYNSILEVIKSYSNNNKTNKKIAININEDNSVSKFMLSTDIETFKNNLGKYSNVSLIEKQNSEYDILMKVKTEGFKSMIYKSIVTFEGKNNIKDKKYYVISKYSSGRWVINVYEDKKPEEF